MAKDLMLTVLSISSLCSVLLLVTVNADSDVILRGPDDVDSKDELMDALRQLYLTRSEDPQKGKCH